MSAGHLATTALATAEVNYPVFYNNVIVHRLEDQKR